MKNSMSIAERYFIDTVKPPYNYYGTKNIVIKRKK